MAVDESNQQELLTERERDVLLLVAYGKSSKEVARHLNISVGGANFHINNAMKKLGAATRAHAVALAIFRGILTACDRSPGARGGPP
ncbi:LuxR family transcriptional regulator (modular protein) [Magnetospirillum sp. SS-4]|nr:LuxR family transcriptional regulator (modular protein) [Magnetospirillum sp. SS-4]